MAQFPGRLGVTCLSQGPCFLGELSVLPLLVHSPHCPWGTRPAHSWPASSCFLPSKYKPQPTQGAFAALRCVRPPHSQCGLLLRVCMASKGLTGCSRPEVEGHVPQQRGLGWEATVRGDDTPTNATVSGDGRWWKEGRD